jgi:peptidoglycan/LPS O-acetylase OafA/YrhL
MNTARLYVLVIVVVAAIVVAALLSHGIRLRLVWGSSGFVVGLVCGVLLTLEIRHRREREKTHGR